MVGVTESTQFALYTTASTKILETIGLIFLPPSALPASAFLEKSTRDSDANC